MQFPVIWMGLSVLAALACAVGVGAVAARCGFPVPDERYRSGTIDGLRGYLSLLVMAQHFSIWSQMTRGGGWRAPPSIMLSNFGVLSVTIFFMITGFLFFPKVAGGFAATRWRPLYISRAFRILPLQVVVVVVVSIVALARQGFPSGFYYYLEYPVRAGQWLTSWSEPNLFGYKDSALVNAGVLWSLRYEWTFYLVVLPVLALFTSWPPLARRPLVIPPAMIVIGLAAHRLHPMPIFLDSLAAFGFGIAVRLAIARGAPAWLRGRLVAACVMAVLLAAIMTLPDPLALAPLAILASFFLCVAAGNPFGGIVTHRGALVLGECSFGIYMLHGIVLNMFFKSAAPMLAGVDLRWIMLLFPPLAMVAAVIAIGAYLLVERPMIRLGRTIVAGRLPARPTATAPSSVSVAP